MHTEKTRYTWENTFYEIATVSYFPTWLQLTFEIGGNNVLFDFFLAIFGLKHWENGNWKLETTN